MTPYEVMSTVLSVLVLMIVPLVVVLIRGAIKWTRVEAKLDTAVTALNALVADKDKVHAELVAQLRDDRRATDERLRPLERWIWSRQPPVQLSELLPVYSASVDPPYRNGWP